jgi:peptide-methionine (S)-S-oxide reductase
MIGAGDVPALDRLLNDHPELARERLAAPGPWLRDKVGGALDGFFKDPYLLWFVSEDAPVHGRLPKNIADVTRAIIRAGRRSGVPRLQEQLDYALRLVAWSGVAQQCGVQIEMLDVLLDAGASPDGASDSALVNGPLAAAEHLVGRGARLTLATARCLGWWDDGNVMRQALRSGTNGTKAVSCGQCDCPASKARAGRLTASERTGARASASWRYRTSSSAPPR